MGLCWPVCRAKPFVRSRSALPSVLLPTPILSAATFPRGDKKAFSIYNIHSLEKDAEILFPVVQRLPVGRQHRAEDEDVLASDSGFARTTEPGGEGNPNLGRVWRNGFSGDG